MGSWPREIIASAARYVNSFNARRRNFKSEICSLLSWAANVLIIDRFCMIKKADTHYPPQKKNCSDFTLVYWKPYEHHIDSRARNT